MEAVIRTFEPVAGTVTRVLLDTWYSAKCLWRAAQERGFLITSGLKSNRWPRVEDATAPKSWRWQRLSDYTAQLHATDHVQLTWPKSNEEVYVHVLTTRVRKHYACQVVIVRQSLAAPLSQARDFASSDLDASPELPLLHLAARWDIEVLFGDGKEEQGLDHYQLMSATAIVRFWTLARLSYSWKENAAACNSSGSPGHHWLHMLDWLHGQFQSGVDPDTLYELLSA